MGCVDLCRLWCLLCALKVCCRGQACRAFGPRIELGRFFSSLVLSRLLRFRLILVCLLCFLCFINLCIFFLFFSFLFSRHSGASLTDPAQRGLLVALAWPWSADCIVSFTPLRSLALSQRSASLLPRHARRRHHGASAFLQTR